MVDRITPAATEDTRRTAKEMTGWRHKAAIETSVFRQRVIVDRFSGGRPYWEAAAIEPVVRLRIELQETNPKVWCRVDMPLSATLLAVHEIIQVLMGWNDVHLFEFTAGDRIYGEPYPDDPNGDRKIYKATSVRLRTLLDRGIHRFLYVYDFGDYWRLDVTVEEVRDGTSGIDYPAFVDGARRAPPEDVGGTAGFEGFLEAVTDPEH